MNKNFRNGLLMLAAGALVVSCADYNDLGGFNAEPDPAAISPYKDLKPVKSYTDKVKYPNMSMGTMISVTSFNNQDREHVAAITNFDDVTFGTGLMSGKIVNEKGVMNFLDMMALLEHAVDINAVIYGSPIVANTNQPDKWFTRLTAPIEIPVDFVEGKTVDYNECAVGPFGDAEVVKYDNQNVLKIKAGGKVSIVDGFDVDPAAKFTITFWAKVDKDADFNIVFSGNKILGSGANGVWNIKVGKWNKFVVEAQSAEGVTEGYLRIENSRKTPVYIQKVQVGYFPDNHRPQTAQEVNDTITYALKTWCDTFMKYNEGRIKTFDLIDEPIDEKLSLESNPDIFDLKHSEDENIFWQDVFGSDNYAPIVSKTASAAYEKYAGDPAQLRFFIAETGLEDVKKFNSLMYWIGVWEAKGAKIDGINAKLTLTYSEDETTQTNNVAKLNTLLDNLAATNKLVRVSNLDVKYLNAEGVTLLADKITAEQRQKLADYYAFVIKSYMNKIPSAKQAGMCKTNMVDTNKGKGEPLGIWAIDIETQDWVRTATYKAFCDALSGE